MRLVILARHLVVRLKLKHGTGFAAAYYRYLNVAGDQAPGEN